MSVYALTQVICYISIHEVLEAKAVHILYPDINKKTGSCSFSQWRATKALGYIYIFLFLLPVKRATKALGYIRGNTEVLSVVRDLKSHLEPWPPFAVSCRCLYYYRDVVGWRGAHRQLTSRFLPPHSFAPWISWLHSSPEKVFCPQCLPKGSDTFERKEKEREKKTQERERERVGTGFFQRTRVPPQRAGKPEQRSAPAYLFAIYKENQLICCHCHRLGSLHSRYLTPSRHWQVSQLWNLNNMPPLKMKGSQPMGGNQLRASGHEEFLAKATGLHNQGKCKQSFSANHTPNTCVKEHAGRHRTSKDISPEARRPWLLSTALVAPASPTGLQKIEKGEGPSSGSGQHSWLIPSISTLLSLSLTCRTHSPSGWRTTEVTGCGAQGSRWKPGIWPQPVAYHLQNSVVFIV